MSFDSLLNTFADIKRPMPDYDDMGGVTYNLVTFAAQHWCRISQGVPSEVTDGPTEYSEANAMVYLHTGYDFKRDDEVHHSTGVYVVLGVHTPSVYDSHQSLVCKLQTDGA